MPATPAATKADPPPHRHPIHGTLAGAISAPAFVPALNRLVAKARSWRENQSATALIADGKLPDSPNPSAARAVMNALKVPANPWAAAATLHAAIDTA